MPDDMTPAEAARVAAMAANMVTPPATPSAATPPADTATPPAPEPAAAPPADDADARFRTVLDGINARIEEMASRLREVEKMVADKVGDVDDEEIVDPTAPNDAPDQMDPVTPPERGATPV